MEFVDNAAKLELFTYQHCGRFPKRYRFTLEIEIIHFASSVYTNVSKSNEYPTTVDQYDKRIETFYESIGLLEAMVRKIRIADELFGINKNVMQDWMFLIEREIRLLCGIIASDKKSKKLLSNDGPT